MSPALSLLGGGGRGGQGSQLPRTWARRREGVARGVGLEGPVYRVEEAEAAAVGSDPVAAAAVLVHHHDRRVAVLVADEGPLLPVEAMDAALVGADPERARLILEERQGRAG